MNINCHLIGDYNVGKTCLVYSYMKTQSHDDLIPTIEDFYRSTLMVENTNINLIVYDPPGSEDYRTVQPRIYPQIDVMIICFSLIDKHSFKNVETIWIDFEIKQITKLQGQMLKEKICAFSYIECSSLQNYNVKKFFEFAALAFLQNNKSVNNLKSKVKCSLA